MGRQRARRGPVAKPARCLALPQPRPRRQARLRSRRSRLRGASRRGCRCARARPRRPIPAPTATASTLQPQARPAQPGWTGPGTRTRRGLQGHVRGRRLAGPALRPPPTPRCGRTPWGRSAPSAAPRPDAARACARKGGPAPRRPCTDQAPALPAALARRPGSMSSQSGVANRPAPQRHPAPGRAAPQRAAAGWHPAAPVGAAAATAAWHSRPPSRAGVQTRQHASRPHQGPGRFALSRA